jgi:hypothetical protein
LGLPGASDGAKFEALAEGARRAIARLWP